ncbi:hypothetical protein I302_106652 [Kwoniella bestiolae CBS 10118]|uniref:Sulfhydryl oxidase n=1 Tax=Kwoniella bestiolae CBS 10118 TaxID=1296100 RepID=A0A1B9G0S9_9TREE|nr:mitochondrial FAD-linked sulfhydryl oxidase ERV1 [Kwoniella bestiolae CBS 10118]OCF24625.1 mitochondrial FAD-linked sulfhydryl oxidase ERV1 [Kwoniella bestiolae CBS 10118]
MTIPPPPPSNPDVSSEPRRTTKETHPHLPPGLILDENGKVCKVCNTWQDFAKIGKKKQSTSSQDNNAQGSGSKVKGLGGMAGFASLLQNSSSSSASTSTQQATINASPVPQTEAEPDRTNCPPDTAALGRSTWTFLHTTASYYPQKPTETQQSKMISLLDSLSTFYPCSWCAKDFQKDMKVNPPEVKTRDDFVKWLCERHNTVNRKLGKPVFECSLGKLDGRWKDGPEDGSCD